LISTQSHGYSFIIFHAIVTQYLRYISCYCYDM